MQFLQYLIDFNGYLLPYVLYFSILGQKWQVYNFNRYTTEVSTTNSKYYHKINNNLAQMTKYFAFFILSMVFLASSCQSVDSEPQPTDAPNIIFILADDLGIGDVEVFNPESKIPTPHMNKMAHEGMIFTDAHTSSSVCTPTRYGILTGRYNWRSPIKSGVLFGRDSALITPKTATIASLLKKANYSTAFIGKWHLGWDWALDEKEEIDFSQPITEGPNELGFDYAYGHIASLDIPPYVYVENRYVTAIPDSIIPATKGYDFYRKGWIAPDFKIEQVTPHFFTKSHAFIEEESKTDNPFFLYLALPSPHTPILPTAEWQDKSGINPYGDFVMEIDHYVGSLMNSLDSLGISENTMVVFTSDNGCSPMANFAVMAEKGHHPSAWYRGHKADIFEGGHRVPTIVKYPKLVQPGSTSGATVCLTDFYATFADLSSVPIPEDQGADSYSIVGLLSDTSNQSFQREATIHSSINGSFAIRAGNWKLNLCPGSGGWSDPRPKKAMDKNLPPVQLYNLESDPGEENNVFKQHPEKVRELYDHAMTIIDDGRSTPGSPLQNDPNGYGPDWTSLRKVQDLEPFVRSLSAGPASPSQ